MLTISKVFTILCLFCLCRNRKHPGSFQNKSISSSFKWVPKYILFLVKLKGEKRPFGVEKHRFILLTISYIIHFGVMLVLMKMFIILLLLFLWEVNSYENVHHPIPRLPLRTANTLAIFKANQYAPLLVECPGTFSFWPK